MRVRVYAFGAAFLSAWVLMATPAALPNPLSERLVHQALQAELEGQSYQRQALLADALDADPEYAPARWHSGHVQHAGGWTTVEEAAARNRGDASLAGYRRLRNASAPTAQGHLQLARFCRAHHLEDQARLHWTHVLAWMPENPAAMRALGLRRYNSQYLSEDQLQQAKAAEQAQKQLEKYWTSRCAQLRRDLTSRDSRTRESGLTALRRMQDPAAIPWLDTQLADVDDEAQVAIIDSLGHLEDPMATLALIRRSVIAPSPAVRKAAACQLRQRPIYSYAPVLLSSIAAPVELSYYVNTLQDGVLAHYSLFREGAEADYLLSFSGGASRSSLIELRSPGSYKTFLHFPGLQERVAAANAIVANFERLSALVREANLQAEEWNQRIFETLTTATEIERQPTPAAWWDWWLEYNELGGYERKPLISLDYAGYTSAHRYKLMSCFMPGTIVWTETGPAPIESVQLGDRVLSQDVGTGELAYKLVLNTTIRPPSEIRRIRTGDSEVHATLGHPFWVVGEGWMMTKELNPGARLHALAGAVVVDAVEPGPISRAHNLVVEDFNTYFVGDAKLLVHDNNLRLPTKALLPGLHGDLLR
jgi:hypothetical protein